MNKKSFFLGLALGLLIASASSVVAIQVFVPAIVNLNNSQSSNQDQGNQNSTSTTNPQTPLPNGTITVPIQYSWDFFVPEGMHGAAYGSFYWTLSGKSASHRVNIANTGSKTLQATWASNLSAGFSLTIKLGTMEWPASESAFTEAWNQHEVKEVPRDSGIGCWLTLTDNLDANEGSYSFQICFSANGLQRTSSNFVQVPKRLQWGVRADTGGVQTINFDDEMNLTANWVMQQPTVNLAIELLNTGSSDFKVSWSVYILPTFSFKIYIYHGGTPGEEWLPGSDMEITRGNGVSILLSLTDMGSPEGNFNFTLTFKFSQA